MALSERQQRIMEFIRAYIDEHDYPPTIREIGTAVGISSTSVVNYNLNKLQELELIKRNPEVSRGLRLVNQNGEQARRAERNVFSVPLVGRIAAGEPILATGELDNPFADEAIELTRDILTDTENVFALEVQGDSMLDASVHDGDIVVLRHTPRAESGDMVAAWIRSAAETTLKYFYLENGKVRLQPANPAYEPMVYPADDVEVQGKVVAVIRRLH